MDDDQDALENELMKMDQEVQQEGGSFFKRPLSPAKLRTPKSVSNRITPQTAASNKSDSE